LIVIYVGSVIYNYFFHPLRHIPGPFVASCMPGAGLISVIKGTIPFDLLELHKEYGPVVRITPDGVSFISHTAMHQIYSTHAFTKHPLYESYSWGGKHLFSSTQTSFAKKRRRMLSPVFALQNIVNLEPTIFDVSVGAILKKWYKMCSENSEDGPPIVLNMYQTVFEMFFGTIGRLVLGKAFTEAVTNHSSSAEVRDRIASAFSSIDKILSVSHLIPSFVQKLIIKGYLPGIGTGIYNVRRNDISKEQDILQLMIDMVDPETGDRMTKDELTAEANLQLVAGTNTSANTLVWTFDFLMANPHVLQKVEEEVLKAYPDPNVRIIYRDAKQQLPYTEAVIWEAMRMRPTAGSYLPRITPADGRALDGYFMPGGTMVGTSSYVMQHLEEYWDDPFEFKPERFLAVSSAERRQKVFPFSMGVRGCIGRHLALVELLVILATLIQHFEIR
ncbi:cytochrome P450, partial [Ramicandelaber brevisporus]